MYPEITPEDIMLIYYLFYALSTLAVSVAIYVLQSIGLSTIARRRGIHNPWLAWLPIGDAWIFGSISDQYRYVTQGQIKNKRKTLLILSILFHAVAIAFIVTFLGTILRIITMGDNLSSAEAAQLLGSAFGMLGLEFLFLGAAVVYSIFLYKAMFDLYRSCQPSTATLFLLLSIFVSASPILLLICRKKDLGMPPRREPTAQIAEPQPEDE